MKTFRKFFSGLMFGLCWSATTIFAQSEINQKHLPFFDTLAMQLKFKYQTCTGDTSRKSTKELAAWGRQVDSFIHLKEYPKYLAEYAEFCDLDYRDVEPCQVMKWKRLQEKNLRETEDFIKFDRIKRKKAEEEKAAIRAELDSLYISPFSFEGLPFGISKKTFRYLATRCSLQINFESKDQIIINKVTLGFKAGKAAFFFTKEGRLYKYEFETNSYSVDSLDSYVRPMADSLANYFEKKIEQAPQKIFRIGKNDIKQNALSIYKSWQSSPYYALLGYSVKDFGYYVKMSVFFKPVDTKKTKF